MTHAPRHSSLANLSAALAVITFFGSSSVAQESSHRPSDTQRAYASELMADAQMRTSLLRTSTRSGYNPESGFTISSDTGDFTLSVQGFVAFRYVAALGTRSLAGASHAIGFQNAASQISFSGHVLSPDTTFKIQLDASDPVSAGPTGGLIPLEQAWVSHKTSGGFTIGAGQFWAPIFHEEYKVSDRGGQVGASRTLATEFFGGGYMQGVWVEFRDQTSEWIFSLNDGIASANSNFDASVGREADIALTIRANILSSGDWDDFKVMTSPRGSRNAFHYGLAIHNEQSGNTLGTANPDVFGFVFDGQYKSDGWQVFAQLNAWHFGSAGGNIVPPSQQSSDQWGIVVQGSRYIQNQVELFGEFDVVRFDNDALRDDFMQFLVLGANYYPFEGSTAARLTLDVVATFSQTQVAPGGSTPIAPGVAQATGIIPSTKQGQVTIRAQAQLAF